MVLTKKNLCLVLFPKIFSYFFLPKKKNIGCKPGIHEAKGHPKNVLPCCFSWLRSLVSVLPFSTFQILLAFVLHTMYRVFTLLNLRNRKKYVYSIFLGTEVQERLFKKDLFIYLVALDLSLGRWAP